MTAGSDGHARPAEELSALADGELDPSEIGRVCAHWRDDPASRATWYSYQLIGDVLRSEDLASDSGRDVAFLGALRARLASEPVVLAPVPLPSTVAAALSGRARIRRRMTWITSSAVAAGFAAVAAVVVVTRESALSPMPGPDSTMAVTGLPAVSMAAAGRSEVPGARGGSVQAVAAPAAVSEPRPLPADGQVIRDAGLDRYLSAHKHFAGSAALGVPSQFLRSATVDSSGR